MVAGLEAERERIGTIAALRAPAPDLEVRRFVISDRHTRMRQIGHREQQGLKFGLEGFEPHGGRLLFGLEGIDFGHQRIDRLALGLQRSDLLVERVAARLQFLGAGLQGLALGLECAEAGHVEKSLVLLAGFETGNDRREVLA